MKLLRTASLLWVAALAIQSHAQWTYGTCASIPANMNSTDFRVTPLVSNALFPSAGLKAPIHMGFDMDANGKVDIYFILKRGQLMYYKGSDKTLKNLGTIPVNSSFSEDGLVGIAMDPNFKTNNRIYVFYSFGPDNGAGAYHLSTFTLDPTTKMLNTSSEKIVLSIPSVRGRWHTSGDMHFDAYGDLWVDVGDNESLLNGPGNSSDLRGKILRIHPNDNGTYSIPTGNFWEYEANYFTSKGRTALAAKYKDSTKVRREIYVMGTRNTYTQTLDPYRRILSWGQCGPDFGGMTEEHSLTATPRFSGWPFWAGSVLQNQKASNYVEANEPSNTAYPGYITGQNPANPVNTWVGTGMNGVDSLPPRPTPEHVYNHSCAQDGPIFRYDGRINNPNKLPPQFDNVWFLVDYNTDGQIWAVKLSADGTVPANATYTQVFSNMKITGQPATHHTIDFQEGPDGAMYLMNWNCTGGSDGNVNSDDCTGIAKIDYTGTCQDATLFPPSVVSLAQTPVFQDVNWLRVGKESFTVYSKGPHEIRILNAQGRVFDTFRGDGPKEYQVPANLPSNGVYFLHVKTNEGYAVRGLLHW